MANQKSIEDVLKSLKELAERPVPSHLKADKSGSDSSADSAVDILRKEVLAELDSMDGLLKSELQDSAIMKFAGWGILLAFGVLVLVGVGRGIVRDKFDWISGALSGTGVFGAIAWVLVRLQGTRKEEIGLRFTVKPYRMKVLACADSVGCIQDVASEVVEEFKKFRDSQ